MHCAVQLYSLRALDRSLPDLVDLVSETPLSGVEFAGTDRDPDEVVAALDRTGLDAPAAHVPIEDLEDDLDAIAERYRTLDCETIVVPWLDPAAFATADAVDDAADRLSALADRLAAFDLDLAYHNHDQEFTAIEGGDAFDAFVPHLSGVGIELDVGWATAAGRDPAALLARYADRIDLVHVKDVYGDRPCALGEGDVDLEACVDAAREADVEWLIYEHDDPDDPEAALRRDADRLAALVD